MKKIDQDEFDALNEAFRYEEQARYERDPRLIAHCLRECNFWLEEAARLERSRYA